MKPVRPASSRRDVLPKGMVPRAAAAHRAGKATRHGYGLSGLIASLLLVAAVTSACLFQVWTRAEEVRLGYELARLGNRVRAAESEQAKLDVETASLASPIRITRLATDHLHLRAPEPGQVIQLLPHDGSNPIVVALARP